MQYIFNTKTANYTHILTMERTMNSNSISAMDCASPIFLSFCLYFSFISSYHPFIYLCFICSFIPLLRSFLFLYFLPSLFPSFFLSLFLYFFVSFILCSFPPSSDSSFLFLFLYLLFVIYLFISFYFSVNSTRL